MQLHNRINKQELKERLYQENFKRITLSFYRYAHINDPAVFRDELYQRWRQLGVFGRIYVASEGINGQISVPEHNFEAFKNDMYSISFLDNTRLNIAVDDDGKSFYVLKIKVRPKIVADGLNDETFDVTKKGIHLDAKAFNEVTSQEDAVIIDMRNHYESEVGHFKGAICPDVDTFRDSLPIIEDMLADKKDKPLVMYCTGGIRCEKASAYFRHKGFNNVYQLDGGIIEYARQVEQQRLENKFIGKNFVFDDRLGERITDDVISQCHQCGAPCDTHINCANDACHLLFIQCEACASKYNKCCSTDCKDFLLLPEEEQKKLRKNIEKGHQVYRKGRHGWLRLRPKLKDLQNDYKQ